MCMQNNKWACALIPMNITSVLRATTEWRLGPGRAVQVSNTYIMPRRSTTTVHSADSVIGRCRVPSRRRREVDSAKAVLGQVQGGESLLPCTRACVSVMHWRSCLVSQRTLIAAAKWSSKMAAWRNAGDCDNLCHDSAGHVPCAHLRVWMRRAKGAAAHAIRHVHEPQRLAQSLGECLLVT